MSVHRLSAGAGYRYLIRHTACGDVNRAADTPLTAYYMESGYPPGRWMGSGLAGLADGRGVAPETTVTEPDMARLFARGHDPRTDTKLGRAYPSFRSPEERAAARIAALPPSLTAEQRQTLAEQIHAREHVNRKPSAVSGFDLTFTVPKSASVLWALGDPRTQGAVTSAHAEAVDDAIAFLETHALFTRTGSGSVAQVEVRGAVAAAFDHWDTRTGDPNLHTHVVLANRVQGLDGEWRALDSRALYRAAVAISEIYDDVFADRLHERLPAAWAWRSRGARRSPAYELSQVDDRMIREFSTRSAAITEAARKAIEAFTRSRGRTPTRPEVLRLRQQVTRANRPTKSVRRLAEQLAEWRDRASRIPSLPRRDSPVPPPAMTADAVARSTVIRLAATVLDGVQQRRSTWTRWNVLAETARACRNLRMVTPAERHRLHDRVTDAVLAACVTVSAADAFSVPPFYMRADGESVFRRHHEDLHTSRTILDAEARILVAHRQVSGPAAQLNRHPEDERSAAVQRLATSGRCVDVLVGAAGTGKTRTLLLFRQAWEATHGSGSVIGLAPSATAARELADALGITCDNTAKWLHESTKTVPNERWQLRAGQMLIVDEASLAGTLTIDQIVQQALTANAKVLLVGDHHQLDAVEAGGAFSLLATSGWPVELSGLWRFKHGWEAQATLRLRDGDVVCLDAYEENGRLHHAPWELAISEAYEAFRTTGSRGKTALLVALDTGTVEALNARARADRVLEGVVEPGGVTVRDGVTLGVGDRVVTRRNERRIRHSGNDFVRNGALWDVVATEHDGAISARLATRTEGSDEIVRLPAEYVCEHVELGYASTLHRAQGMTVDSAHVIATSNVTREALYVGMTRGRDENHCYLATDVSVADDGAPEPETDPRLAMENILARTGHEQSATQLLAESHAETHSTERLETITATVLSRAATDRWMAILPSLGYSSEIVRSIRSSTARGPLVTMLQNGMLVGHDMDDVLRQVAPRVTEDDPAEYLHTHVQNWLLARETEQDALTLEESRRRSAQLLTDDTATSRLIDELRDAAGRRLAHGMTVSGRPAWLPPSPTTPTRKNPPPDGLAEPPRRSPQI